MKIQYTKNLNRRRFELDTTLNKHIRFIVRRFMSQMCFYMNCSQSHLIKLRSRVINFRSLALSGDRKVPPYGGRTSNIDVVPYGPP